MSVVMMWSVLTGLLLAGASHGQETEATESPYELISVARFGDRATAIISGEGSRRLVKLGGPFSNTGYTLTEVEIDYVELTRDGKTITLILNKADAVGDLTTIESLRNRYPNAVTVSAQTGDGLPKLATAVSNALSRDFLDLEIHLDAGNGRLQAYLAQHGEVLSRTFVENRVIIHCRIAQKHVGAIQESEEVQVRPYEPVPTAPDKQPSVDDVA